MAERKDPGDAGADGEGGLRSFLDGGMLERAESAIRRRLAAAPGDLPLLRRLADLLRQRGDLPGAAAAYGRVRDLAPRDAFAARMAALLAGSAMPPPDPIPTRFFLQREFLPPDRLEAVRAHVRRHRRRFRATEVRTADGEQHHAMETRRSASCAEVAAIREWFDALLLARFRDVCIRTGLEPFEPRILSCRLTAWHDGGFFRLHQDRATGVAATRRLGFLYYFDFPPRRFRGGELVLYDRDPDSLWPRPSFTNLPPENNSLAILPSHCWHEVLPVRCESDDWYAARFTFSGWIHDAALMGEGEEAGGDAPGD